MKMIKNAAGRLIPEIANNTKQIPYMGIGKYIPKGNKAKPQIKSCASYPLDGNKVVASLKEALIKSGIKDGITISTHHHLRNGDILTNYLFDIIKEMGIKNIRWFPSASFPCHEHLIPYLEDGTIHHIEGSMNGP
ncbi:MAG TPA: citrate lyase subunit alpha, partial [Melioribacteraceae bacterium]|nr:citrate lyase subunit alpha [Melioribacteraceae bacterium]